MDASKEITFEQALEYLLKAISPDRLVAYPPSVPHASTPVTETIIYYYEKHHPSRNAPPMFAIVEGYRWLWREFAAKVKVRSLSLGSTDREERRQELAAIFAELQKRCPAYEAQIKPLDELGHKLYQTVNAPKYPKFHAYYYGNSFSQQALMLKKAIQIINAGSRMFNVSCANNKTSKESKITKPKTNKAEVTQEALALFYIYGQKKKNIAEFQSGKMVSEYKNAVMPYGLSWKNFQIHFLRLQKTDERMVKENLAHIKKAIIMLENFPEAKAMALDELNTIKTR
ncbi:hypothetical protein GCM10027592_03660 [Spirosoma flavus]